MNPHKPAVITIDGASGTGKGTIGQMLANYLGWKFLDSGALYRILGLVAQIKQIDLADEESLAKLAIHLDVEFIAQKNDLPRIFLNGSDVTEMVRSEEAGNRASIISALPSVRTSLLKRQRDFRESPGLVADGRDMGTVIFPDADLKIFLLASLEERAMRRYKQLKQRGINATLSDLMTDLSLRDKRDQERLVAPLKPADDAICINTDNLTIGEVMEHILVEISKKKAFPVISHPRNKSLGIGVTE